jgi:uncharacterized membrane protein YdbT with pleckstrin-like domain
MPGMQLRPSTKFVKLGYVVCLALAVAMAVYLKSTGPSDASYWWALIVPVVLFVFLLARHLGKLTVKLEVFSDHLRYESGLISKTTRSEQLLKVQDVRVDQTIWQRIAGLGDLSYETAGGSSRIVIHSIDNPQRAADHILELARNQHPPVSGT